nr:hypothetical protein [Elusimicrobiaceae bacterium]
MNIVRDVIIKGNCLEELKRLPGKSVDVVFADPPYNLQLKNPLYRPNNTMVDAVDDQWDKFSSFEEYDNFTIEWLTQCRRVLKDNGTLWVIGSYHNIFRVGKILMDLGFWILNDIQWIKTNPMPNFKGTRFTNASETLIWCKKSETQKKYTFNYKLMKQLNNDKQMTSTWTIPICGGKERLRDSNGEKLHSTQKPEELLKRIILSSTEVNDLILDPFFGSGTTGAVAKKLKRHFIGIEQEEKYIKIAQDRINKITSLLPEATIVIPEKTKIQKVPFKTLIDVGIINSGEKLYSRKRYNKEALILQDGNLLLDNSTGSIHKIGALIEKTTSCNGWLFWYYKRDKKVFLLDELRKLYFSKIGAINVN